MAEEKRKFNKGDFLTKNNKKGSFMIYEGNNLSDTSYKRMTLVCYYDPEKFEMGAIGYEQKPSLEVATKYKACTTTIDTEEEDYWIHICSDQEREEAMNVLAKYGLYWDEQGQQLVHMETGEVIRKITTPDNKYYGQVIKPITTKFKDLIKKYCADKITPKYDYSQNYSDECWD